MVGTVSTVGVGWQPVSRRRDNKKKDMLRFITEPPSYAESIASGFVQNVTNLCPKCGIYAEWDYFTSVNRIVIWLSGSPGVMEKVNRQL